MITLTGCEQQSSDYRPDGMETKTPTFYFSSNAVTETPELFILEKEKTITLHSFWNPEVRDAINLDIKSDINAVYLDLETGELGQSGNSDIRYALSCGSACFPFITKAGDRLSDGDIEPFGQFPPSLSECYDLIKTKDHGDLFSTQYGYYSCVVTEEGRYGWVRFDADFRSGLNQGDIQITYWLWAIPPEAEK